LVGVRRRRTKRIARPANKLAPAHHHARRDRSLRPNHFEAAARDVLRGKAANNGNRFRNSLTGNFRIINRKDFQVPA
jgi:hypothetical protein